jgi:hypothetical protein
MLTTGNSSPPGNFILPPPGKPRNSMDGGGPPA